MKQSDESKTKKQLIKELDDLREKLVQIVSLSELETIFRILPDTYFRMDEQGTILDFKAGRYSDLFGKPETFLGSKIEEILAPQAAQKIMAALAEAGKTQALTIVEYSLPFPEGCQYYEARFLPFEHHQFLSVIRNITGYHKLEQESVRLQYFLRLNPNPIIETDHEGRLTYLNPAAAKEFPRLDIGNTDHPLLREIPLIIRQQEQSRKKLTVCEIEIDNRVYEQHISYIPSLERLHIYMIDITERKQTEAEIRQHREHLQAMVDERTVELETINQKLQEEIAERKKTEEALKIAKDAAESANRMKSRFLANMSHDIRTPLNSILGFTNLLLNDRSNERATKFLKKIMDSGDALLSLINDILDFSKIEAGQMDIYPQTFLLEELLESINSLFQLQFKQKGIAFEIKKHPGVPERIYSDKWRLHQVLTNLLSNSLKFTQEGSTSVEINYNQPEDRLIFAVKDTGTGIPENKINEIFQPFTRLQTYGEFAKTGTGIGLAICKNLVNLMGGDIKVLSQENKGSRFIFAVPAETLKAQQEPLIRKINKDIRLDLQKKGDNQILIVDDNPVNLELIGEQLQNAGFHSLLTAKNGEEAVQTAVAHNPDLILMDIQMPVLDGNEAINELRQKGFVNPIVALSAFAMKDHIHKSLNAGANGYITKPIDFDQFFSQIIPFLSDKKDDCGTGRTVDKENDHGDHSSPSFPGRHTGEKQEDGIHIGSAISKRLRGIFLKDAQNKLAILTSALQDKNLLEQKNVIKVIAHNFKGNAGFMGLTRLEYAAKELEQAIITGEATEQIIAQTEQLVGVLAKIIHFN